MEQPCQVHHTIHASDGRLDGSGIGEVADAHLDNRWQDPAVAIVPDEGADTNSPGDQRANDGRADRARGPGDEDTRHRGQG
jgi:hypothetical protein